jgi:hypothetical protein
MTKTLHWCALRITDLAYLVVRLGDHLWELGGSLEAWCDERAERKRWVEYARDNESFPTPKAWLMVPPVILTGNKFDPDADYARMHVQPMPRRLELTEEKLYQARQEYEEWLAEQNKKEQADG